MTSPPQLEGRAQTGDPSTDYDNLH
jgi:hypothetical protein